MAVQLATFRDRDRGKSAAAAAVPKPAAESARAERSGAGKKVAGAAAAAVAAGSIAASSAKAKGKAATGWAALLAYFPSPRAAGALVICMIGLGTIIGTATSQIARSAGVETIIVDIAKKPPPPAPEPEPEEAEPEEEVAEAPEEPPAIVAIPEEPLPEEIVEEPPPEEPLPEEPTEELPPEEEFDPTATEELPPVKHVWMIVLGENGYEETLAPTATAAPYLSQTLPEQGELLTNYYAVTSGKLANQVALLSGQGPTPETVGECPPTELAPLPTDIVPGTISPETGQVEGNGCLYPKEVETLPGQLVAAKLKWKTYVQEVVPGTPEAKTCPRPFAVFHSIADTPECLAAEAPLSKLAKDLKATKTTPTFSYIIPNACSAGAVIPCTPETPPGPAATETFLKEVVPEIVKSKAYTEGGLVIITSAQAPQVAPAIPDTSSCCATPAYPNLPPLPEEPPGLTKKTGGGGHVGLLLLSNFVKPGTVNETTYANHFTLLLTLEEIFELEKLGYANEPALLPFDSSVFNYLEETEESSSVEAE